MADEGQLQIADKIVVQTQADKTIASVETLIDGDFQRVWFLAMHCHLVFATYHSEGEANREELSIVEEIVASIRIMSGRSRN